MMQFQTEIVVVILGVISVLAGMHWRGLRSDIGRLIDRMDAVQEQQRLQGLAIARLEAKKK